MRTPGEIIYHHHQHLALELVFILEALPDTCGTQSLLNMLGGLCVSCPGTLDQENSL